MLPPVLARLGLEPPPAVQGRDLLLPLPDRPLFSEIDTIIAHRAALLRGDLKIIWNPLEDPRYFANEVEEQSFDLGSDPLELSPLGPDQARIEEVRLHRAALRALGEALGGEAGATGGLDASLVQDLEALGYGGMLDG